MVAKIPPRYLAPNLEIPNWGIAPYVDGRGLCLCGPVGSGKTTALCLIAYEACLAKIRSGELKEIPWRFISFPAFVMQLQNAWRSETSEQTAYALLKAMAEMPCLIIDDLGAEKLTDYVRQATYYLINEREQWERPTYLTTNFSLSDLDKQFDSRISSRIAGMCDVKALKGKDRRLER